MFRCKAQGQPEVVGHLHVFGTKLLHFSQTTHMWHSVVCLCGLLVNLRFALPVGLSVCLSVNSSYFGVLIGCVIGGFFGILIVFGLIYVFLQRSETFRECFSKSPASCPIWALLHSQGFCSKKDKYQDDLLSSLIGLKIEAPT